MVNIPQGLFHAILKSLFGGACPAYFRDENAEGRK